MNKKKVMINSVPKSGTHLLSSAVSCLPGMRYRKLTLNGKLSLHPVNILSFVRRGETCLCGLGQPKKVWLGLLGLTLKRLKENEYCMGHLPYDPRVVGLLSNLGIRTFFVIRDPRDIVISQIYHVLRVPGHRLHQDYRNQGSMRGMLLASIKGIRRPNGTCKLYGIHEKLALTVGWLSEESVMTVKFEDLIGPQGGGDLERQIDTIVRMSKHIGFSITREEAIRIGSQFFGKGSTFRKGQIGDWRSHFDEESKELFKQLAGTYLITLGYEKDFNW